MLAIWFWILLLLLVLLGGYAYHQGPSAPVWANGAGSLILLLIIIVLGLAVFGSPLK